MIYKGFKFGMLLQLAVGPMCLMVFNSSATYGLIVGLSLVLAITLVDLLFITLSGLGVAAIINKNKVKLIIKILGSVILLLFGANMIASSFNFTLLPNITFFTNVSKQSIFVQGLLLTASNPLTIIFWSGVFSSQVIENKYNKLQLLYFGIGCILSTLCFLSSVALLGTLISGFLSPIIIQILNVGVGIMIIYFGIRLLLKKQ
ncbi:MAG: putative efflux protein [Herbinix sp.]|jgi:threonine/homoserine/homoserine lactone efflux protein|nr:putative efflux protein [Herbinix sp.]